MRHPISSLIGGSSATAGIATHSTGDVYAFAIPFKAKVRKVWVLVQGASSHATRFIIKFDKRVTAGSDVGRGDGDVGAISKTASISQQGVFLYEIPSSMVTVEEGDEIVAQVTTANGEACAAWVGVELEYIPEEPGNNSSMLAA